MRRVVSGGKGGCDQVSTRSIDACYTITVKIAMTLFRVLQPDVNDPNKTYVMMISAEAPIIILETHRVFIPAVARDPKSKVDTSPIAIATLGLRTNFLASANFIPTL